MHRTLGTLLVTLLAATALVFTARAQDTPPANPSQTPPAKTTPKTPAAQAPSGTAPAAKTPAAKTPAAKPGAGATAAKPAPLPLKTPKERASYAIGTSMGKSMKSQGVDIDPTVLARGIRDALAGRSQMTDEEAKAAMTEFQAALAKKQEEKAKIVGEANKKAGDAFLAANKTKPGVVTLPSGLQYKILTAGTGPKPTATDTVVCNYKGSLLDGKEFDSSYKRGQPATFPVGQVIKGWTEALQLMPVGSKWELFLPADLGYGPRAAGPDITPNSTLIFEVELLSIKPPEPAKPADPKAEPPKDSAKPQ